MTKMTKGSQFCVISHPFFPIRIQNFSLASISVRICGPRKINILLKPQSSSPTIDGSLQECMAQAHVSNTHKALIPAVYTPVDRCFGVLEILKTFTKFTWWARWRGDTHTNHSSKRQTETSSVVKSSQLLWRSKRGSKFYNVTPAEGHSVACHGFLVKSSCLAVTFKTFCNPGLGCSPAAFVSLVPPLTHTHAQCSSHGDPLVPR